MALGHVRTGPLPTKFELFLEAHFSGQIVADNLGQALVLIIIGFNLALRVTPQALLGVGVHLEEKIAPKEAILPITQDFKLVVPLRIAAGRGPNVCAA